MSSSSPAFILDAMLGSLARKLRIFGYDTAYYKNGSDEGLIEEARKGGRILVTSDRALAERAIRGSVTTILVKGTRDSQRVAELKAMADEKGIPLSPGGPRCALCNNTLRRLRRREVSQEVPPGVSKRHRTFYFCVHCGKVYWRGRHWTRLGAIERRLGRKNAFNQSVGQEPHDAHTGPGLHHNLYRTHHSRLVRKNS